MSAVLATAATKPVPADLNPQSVLGNIFWDNEPLVILCKAAGDSVDYTVRNYWGKIVDSGKAPVKNGIAEIRPNLKQRGYFEAAVKTDAGEKVLCFAVLAPIDFKTMANSPFAVCSHFATGWNRDLIALLPRLGIAEVREDMPWRWVERDKEGEYSFTFVDSKGQVNSRLDDIHAELKQYGVGELPVAAYCSNKLYDKTEFPTSQRGAIAFGKFCVEVLKHFPDFQAIELWNEYNGSWGPPKGTPPADKARLYAQLCKAAYGEIKKASPKTEVLGGAAVRVPMPYLEDIFKAGALDYMDGVVVHPYIGSPETFYRAFGELRDLIKKYNKGQEKPIWATEFSWGMWGVESRQEQANFIVRGSVIMLAQNVKKMHWFELRDSPMFSGGQCLLHSDTDPQGKYAPWPLAVSYATLIRVLHDGQFEAREAYTPFTNTWVFRFKTGQEEVRCCWNSGEDKSAIAIETDAPLTMIDIMGNETRVIPQNGKIELPLTGTPFFLKGKARSVTAVQGPWKFIANNRDDFKDAQDSNGWLWGYYDGGAGPAAETVPVKDFKKMKLVTDNWGYKWEGGGARVSESSLWTAKNARPTVRWQSHMDGTAALRGSYKVTKGGKDTFTSVGYAIYVDGKQVYAKEVKATVPEKRHTYVESFEIPVTLKKGSVVDFMALPGGGGMAHPALNASICVANPER